MAGIVIVGAGESGARAAFSLRENGYGKSITLIGDEPVYPYERPPLSKKAPPALKAIAHADAYEAAGIDLLLGHKVQTIDTKQKRVELPDRTVAYEKLLMATGARPKTVPGSSKARTLRTFRDAEMIALAFRPSARILIIGCGLIGMELASTARSAGAEVTILQRSGRVMSRSVLEPIAAIVTKRHEEEGVSFRSGVPAGVLNDNVVETDDGGRHHADFIVTAIGSVPNDELAAAAGLKIRNGILVNEKFQTSDEHIYASGDCCTFPYRGGFTRLEAWRAARDQAEHVAKAMLGFYEPYQKVPWFWTDQYDLGIQIAGIADTERSMVCRDVGRGGIILFQTGPDGALQFAGGIGTGNQVAKDIKLAEMMIARGIRPDPDTLANPAANLKKLLIQMEGVDR